MWGELSFVVRVQEEGVDMEHISREKGFLATLTNKSFHKTEREAGCSSGEFPPWSLNSQMGSVSQQEAGDSGFN